MSDGLDSGRWQSECGISQNNRFPSGNVDFCHAITRLVVAQLCESSGFERGQPSAVDTLADAVVRYVCDVGKTASFYSNLSGRTRCNVFDIIQALEDLKLPNRFRNAPIHHHCLVKSSVVSEIMQYVEAGDEIPFAQLAPCIPVVKPVNSAPSFALTGKVVPQDKHIPDWLPAFPHLHTYVHTTVWNEKVSDPKIDKIEQARQRRNAERSLMNLQQRLVGPGTVEFISTSKRNDDACNQMIEDDISFLSPPLAQEEEEVVSIAHPDENLSVLDTFMPVIEAVNSEHVYAKETEKLTLPTKRSALHFNISFDKRFLSSLFSQGANYSGKTALWFSGPDDKDDKKRRAQLILRECADNPQELHQL